MSMFINDLWKKLLFICGKIPELVEPFYYSLDFQQVPQRFHKGVVWKKHLSYFISVIKLLISVWKTLSDSYCWEILLILCKTVV